MNYDTFKQYMKRLAGEYVDKSYPTNYSFIDFVQWITLIPEPEKQQEEKWKPEVGDIYYFPSFDKVALFYDYRWNDDGADILLYERGLCCKTPDEAIALAERMLEAIKN